MFEIAWVKYSSDIDIWQYHKYLFKRKKLSGRTLYEIWKDGDMEYNTFQYFDFMQHVKGAMELQGKKL